MNKAIGCRASRASALVLPCLVILSLAIPFLAGCSRNAGANTVACNGDGRSAYPEAVSRMLPSYSVINVRNPAYAFLSGDSAVEAFDAQAVPAIESGIADHWYPHYLATAVIAVDRDRTGAAVTGWGDLPDVGEEVGLQTADVDFEMLTAAVAYGLEGEGFTLGGAMGLYASLNSAGLLARNSFDPPILICFDHQAAALAKSGRDIEIIVPSEGTLTYAKGLLSKTALSFSAGPEPFLLDAGFRLADGSCDPSLYPDAAAYGGASQIADYSHLNTVSQDSYRVFRRSVLNTRLYSSSDGREHQLFVLVYIALVVAWISSLIHRAAQQDVRRIAFCMGLILLGWITVRLIKYQLPADTALNRYLWFGYYLFQLSLPLIFLRLAFVIDKDGGAASPKWMRGMFSTNAALAALVLTNDLHNLVFRLDLANPNWASEYSYGVMYYIVLAGCFAPLVLAIGMMIHKGRRSLRKSGLAFPLALFALLALYALGYIYRIPLAWESDMTMMVGLFTLMFTETAVRAGMIPVNSKYIALFRRSTLGMKIIDAAGQTAWSSASSMEYSEETLRQALASYPAPVQQDESTLLFAANITGGCVVYQENITDINRMHRELEESVSKLETANALLAEEERVKRAIDAESAATALMTQLETEIARHTIRLSTMIEQLGSMADQNKATARILLLLCYIKRRCNLFFTEREAPALSRDTLAVYLDELAETASYCGVEIIVAGALENDLSVRRATLLYDFLYNIIYWATWLDGKKVLAHLCSENERTGLRILLSEDGDSFRMDGRLETALGTAGGSYEVKAVDDNAVGLSLTFPIGGGSYV